jgi:outer membrane lipoprotein-sorting protein
LRVSIPRNITVGLALAATALATAGCLVKRETRVHPAELPSPPQEATLQALVAQLDSWSAAVRTLTATVDLEPTAGSVYSGVIKEYRDVKGFILLESPSLLRMQGQAPVVRTQVFDMVSDGEEFRLYIPPKQKFIVGKTALRRSAKNSLENLRPQHILQALLVPAIDAGREKCFLEENEDGSRLYYIVTVVEPAEDGELQLQRKAWFDRSNLELSRMQFYSSRGSDVEDVRYADYQDFQGIRYPTRIEVARPIEDYRLAIIITKASFNQPIGPDKFELKKPEGAQLVDLSAAPQQEKPRGQ